MESKNIFYMFYMTAALVILCRCHISASTEIPLQQVTQKQQDKDEHQYQYQESMEANHPSYQSLKRKKRYLEFPEGSSFQLVYDLIIGVVDYTNYLILGVTVALAWELPSKPPSEIFEDLNIRLKDGTLGTSRNDTVQNIKYISLQNKTYLTKLPGKTYQYNLNSLFKIPMHYKYFPQQLPDTFYKHQQNKQWPRITSYIKSTNYTGSKNNKYYTPKESHPFTKWTQNENKPSYSLQRTYYPWWSLPARLKNSFIKHPGVRRFDQNIYRIRSNLNYKKPVLEQKTFPGSGRSEHSIYPIFGKRCILESKSQNKIHQSSTHSRLKRSGIISGQISKLDQMHIKHHRRTRHELYQRIETYLNGRGSNGHHCVLRALCETGQKSHEHKPGSFVGEIMRAIFTIPEPSNETSIATTGYKEQRYDEAITLRGDCAARYHLCKDSLWSSHFVL